MYQLLNRSVFLLFDPGVQPHSQVQPLLSPARHANTIPMGKSRPMEPDSKLNQQKNQMKNQTNKDTSRLVRRT